VVLWSEFLATDPGPVSIPGASTRNSGTGKRSTQPREYK
jgi:hypothetical protein